MFTCCHGTSRCNCGRVFIHNNFGLISIWKSLYVYLLPWHFKMQAKFMICIQFCLSFFFFFSKESMNIVEPDMYSGFVWWFFTRKKAWIIWKTICMEL
ncbi:hypothetical protein AMTRI_Chr05g58920 [Amborella trichopoda]